ncbi:hypothetical protein [Conexibacter woesei]|uniref:DUF4430 domain-containing protein n=1 Tax=Conexibacter woesei (strain DSM 14684 / CCUG 47730 / CIP 108061 / JCM 11494 / NBRC 100937 / ID131577) TaxID=469383 RepID=D3F181_CONWI|nr:hypothetical protein [Conexibacter woesei]ADB50157.1 hypothetical protein Cwoe_1730 [Conexibacter woesei DSM 14684]
MQVKEMFGRRARRAALPLAAVVAACAALPAGASATDYVRVRVEGQTSTLRAETRVAIGTGSGYANQYGTSTQLPIRCRDNTAAEALEQATRGSWDRRTFIETIERETHRFAPGSWGIFINRNYADWGICDLRLRDGDSLVFQATTYDPNPNYRPYSPILQWTGANPTVVSIGTSFSLTLTRWDVPNTPDTPDPAYPPGTHWLTPASTSSAASGYTVTDGTYRQTTNGSGVATFTISTPGTYTFKGSIPGSSTNWSRSLPWTVCVEDPNDPTC